MASVPLGIDAGLIGFLQKILECCEITGAPGEGAFGCANSLGRLLYN
nr:hypothetical protein [Mesorhizobium sp. Pch-S]